MTELISEKVRKARKDYDCMACEWLLNVGEYSELTFTEKRAIIKAKQNKYKIKKGDLYLHQIVKHEGEICSFRAIPEIDKICRENDFYIE